MAKRDFSVRSEVRCDEAGTMCYDVRSGAPFSGELRLYYPDGKVQASLFYANGRQDGKYRVFLRTEVCVIPAFIRTGNRKAC